MMKRLVCSFALVTLLLAGCERGGVELTGAQRVAAPEVPADAGRWLNGTANLAALKGHVVLVEAWHPS